MAAMNASNGAVDGTPIMGAMPHPKRAQPDPRDPREQLNTYIYDYFLRNSHFKAARAMLDSADMKMATGQPQKPSPNTRPNGVDAMDSDSADNYPPPQLPPNQVADNSFLLDWWVQFWDIYQATKNRTGPTKGTQYIQHTRVSRLLLAYGAELTRATEPHPDAERTAQPAPDDEQPHERPVSDHDARRHGQWRGAQRAQARRPHQQPTVRIAQVPPP